MHRAQPTARSLRYARLRTILLLLGGFAARYYCRADLSVTTPLLAAPLLATRATARAVLHA